MKEQWPSLLDDIDAKNYHGDIWGSRERPTFSRSMAVKLLNRSPKAAFAAHPKLGGHIGDEDDEPEEEATEDRSEDAEHGSIYHELLLGGGKQFVVLAHENFRTKAARAERDAALAEGLIPVAEPKWQGIRHVADRMRESLVAAGINLAECRREVTALWESENEHEPRSGAPIRCKARLDGLDDNYSVVIIRDLKVCKYISKRGFLRGMEYYGHDIQAASYVEAVEAAWPKMAGRIRFEFLLIEKKPPYDVAIIPADKIMLAMGLMKWRIAKLQWAQCLATGKWPGMGRVDIAIPPYLLAEATAKFIEAFGPEQLPDWLEEHNG